MLTQPLTSFYKELLTEIENYNQSIGAPDFLLPIKAMLQQEMHTVDIAVLGQFKAGKSSLLNSITGLNILPVGVVPLTAVVTYLQYGEEEKLDVRYTDGFSGQAGLNELALYVTEKYNPGNIKQVQYVTVFHPLLRFLDNVRLIDTPGLGSFYTHNSDATTQWMPFTGVALIAVSAERPLSEDDLALIKEISNYCPDIGVVITKTDLFNETESGNIKRYISDCLTATLDKPIPVFEFSSYINRSFYSDILFNHFILPFTHNTDYYIRRIIHRKFRTIIAQSIRYCEFALQSALKHETEKEQIAKTITDLQNNRHYREQEMMLSVTAFKGDIRKRLEAIFLRYIHKINERAISNFRDVYSVWSGRLKVVTIHFGLWLEKELSLHIARMDEENFHKVDLLVKEIADYLQYTGLQFKQQLDDKLFTVFNVHLPDIYWQIDFMGVEKPDISIYRTFESHLDMLLFFLPMNHQTKPLFEKHFMHQIPLETDKNIERYISSLTVKIFKTIDDIHRQSLQYMNNELRKVQDILSNSANSSEEIQQKITRLQDILKEFPDN